MGSKILIVDDERDVAKAWAKALKIAKHDVQIAQDARTARELSRANPFDLVILDYVMPTMSGIELLNEIRKDRPFIRSIIISGKLDLTIGEDELLSDIQANVAADRYLHKPLENAKLKEAVDDLLAKSTETDWNVIAEKKLESVTTKKSVREAEKNLNKKKKKKKK